MPLNIPWIISRRRTLFAITIDLILNIYLYSKGYKNILLIGVQGFKDEKKNYEAISFLNLINIQFPDLKITSISKNRLGIKSKIPSLK